MYMYYTEVSISHDSCDPNYVLVARTASPALPLLPERLHQHIQQLATGRGPWSKGVDKEIHSVYFYLKCPTQQQLLLRDTDFGTVLSLHTQRIMHQLRVAQFLIR